MATAAPHAELAVASLQQELAQIRRERAEAAAYSRGRDDFIRQRQNSSQRGHQDGYPDDHYNPRY